MKTFDDFMKFMEKSFKKRVKTLFKSYLEKIEFGEINKKYVDNEQDYANLKKEIQMVADKILDMIPYRRFMNDFEELRRTNVNYKMLTAGLLYYIDTIYNLYPSEVIAKVSKYASSTIRKKFEIYYDILGDAENFYLKHFSNDEES